MENKVNKGAKLLLMGAASAAGAFIFYMQGAKLEYKADEISKARIDSAAVASKYRIDSFRVALNYKDSMILFLRKYIRTNTGGSPRGPIIRIVKVPVTQSVAKAQMPKQLYDGITALANSTSRYLDGTKAIKQSVFPFYGIDIPWLESQKKKFNDSLNYKLGRLCDYIETNSKPSFIEQIVVPGKENRKIISPKRVAVVKRLFADIDSTILSGSYSLNLAASYLSSEERSNYSIIVDEYGPLSRQNLNNIKAIMKSNDDRVLIDRLKVLCKYKSKYSYYNYFR